MRLAVSIISILILVSCKTPLELSYKPTIPAQNLKMSKELQWASLHKKTHHISVFLNQNPQLLYAQNKRGETLLHLAAKADDRKTLDYLIACGANIESLDKRGKTPLLSAAYTGKTKAFSILYNHGANIAATDKTGNNASHLAAIMANQSFWAQLLELNPQLLNHRNKRGEVAAHFAAYYANADALAFLGNQFTHLDRLGRSPFLVACQSHYANDLLTLALHNKIVQSRDKITGSNALHYAVMTKKPLTAKALIEKGTPVNTKNLKGQTALMMASQKGDDQLISLFLAYNASVTQVDVLGNSLFHKLNSKDPLIINQLASKASLKLLNQPNKEGQITLLIAAHKRKVTLVKALLARGANVNLQDKSSESALHKVARNQNRKILILLLNAGIQTTLKNEDGQTALHLALQKRSPNISFIESLIHQGKALNLINDLEQTALDLAAIISDKEKAFQLMLMIRSHGGKTAKELKALKKPKTSK